MKHASKWCPSASLVSLAKLEALQVRAPEPCPRRAPGTPSYAMESGAPWTGADPDAAPPESPASRPQEAGTSGGAHPDMHPSKGRHPPSHREARPAPSSGKAWGLSPGGPQTLPRSRGRHSGTTWRRALRHVSLKKAWGKEGPTLRSSSPRPLRSCRNQESYASIATYLA